MSSEGVLIFAINNETINYVKQSIFCAKRVKKFLNLPVTVVTNSPDEFEKYSFKNKYIDNIISVELIETDNYKNFSKGELTIRDKWHNYNRVDAYELSPYEKTLVIDCDYIINNSNLKKIFSSNKNIALAKKYKDFFGRSLKSIEARVSRSSIPMYWATVIYFEKSEIAKSAFDFAKYVRDNWTYHRTLYNISSLKFRNDYAFSIALHVMKGFRETPTLYDLPFTLYNSFDKDIPLSIGSTVKILSNDRSNYNLHYLQNINVHIMNKIELEKLIDEDFASE